MQEERLRVSGQKSLEGSKRLANNHARNPIDGKRAVVSGNRRNCRFR